MPAEHYQIAMSDRYSGNVTLNKLLRHGGFTLPHDERCGLVVLLRGKPGTGKSTLALQILEGLEPNASTPTLSKYYCSVEQTVTDLHFKRLSMLVAQAILPAWEPEYHRKDPDTSKLTCNIDTFMRNLPEDLRCYINEHAKLNKSVKSLLRRLYIPLYDGPSDIHHVLPNEAREIAEFILESQGGKSRKEAEERIRAFLSQQGKEGNESGGNVREAASHLEQRKQQILLDCRLSQAKQPAEVKHRKAIATQNLAQLLFESEITHSNHALRFRGLEDHAGVLPADEPLGAGRSRSLGALRMLDAIVAELQGNSPVAERDRKARPVVVIDGLSLLANSEREILEIQGIVDRLRQLSQLGIIVYEPSEDESVNLDHHADMVIELQRKELKDPMAYLIHEICLKKARYQETALGQHQFKIRRSGLVFFPSVHFHIQHASYMDFEVIRSTPQEYTPVADPEEEQRTLGNQRSIVDMIFPQKSGDIGESIMLLGSRGTFKTELTLDFLSRGSMGCQKGKQLKKLEKGLLVSLIDNSPSIERGLWCPWRKARYNNDGCAQCQESLLKNARPFKQPPGCISSAEFLYYLNEVIGRLQKEQTETQPLSRLVFWDLTQLDHRFPLLKADSLLVPALIDVFKQRKLRSLFMGAENATHTAAASAMADNVLFCWRSHTFEESEPWKGDTPKARQKEENGWKLREVLMLYVDRASTPERPGTILYNIPIYNSDDRECLLLPEGARAMNSSPYMVDWRHASQEDQDHITRLRRLQGLE